MRYKKMIKKINYIIDSYNETIDNDTIDNDTIDNNTIDNNKWKICNGCKSKIDRLALFCPLCFEFQTDMDYRVCCNCGKPTEIDSKYCRHCGHLSIIL